MSRGLLLWNILMLATIWRLSSNFQALWNFYPGTQIFGKDFYASLLMQSRMMLDGAFDVMWVQELNAAWQRSKGIEPLFDTCPYPPLLPIVSIPFTYVAPGTAVNLLLGINLTLSLLSGTLTTWWALGQRAKTPAGLLAGVLTGIVFTMGAPSFDTLISGQAGFITFSLTALYAWALTNGKRRLAAFFLSLAVSLKVYPAVFLLWPLIHRDGKFLQYFTLGMLGWTLPVWFVAGWRCPDILWNYYTVVAPHAASFSNDFGSTNLSLAHTVGRWTQNHALARLASLAALVVGGLSIYRLPRCQRGMLLAFAISSMLQLLSLGRTWAHYHGILFLAGVCIWKAESKHNLPLCLVVSAGVLYHQLVTGEMAERSEFFQLRLPLFQAGVPCWITLSMLLYLCLHIWTTDWKRQAVES